MLLDCGIGGGCHRALRQQQFVVGKPHQAARRCRQQHRARIGRPAADSDAEQIGPQLFDENLRAPRVALDEKPQRVDAKPSQIDVRLRCGQCKAKHALGGVESKRRRVERRATHRRGLDRQRQQQRVPTGPIVAGLAGDAFGFQHRAARHGHRLVEIRGCVEARHHERRHRLHQVRVKRQQQRIGKFRKFVVDLVPQPGVHERYRFDQPADVRVFDSFARQPQSRGDLGMRVGEGSGTATQEVQLTLIIFDEVVDHLRF